MAAALEPLAERIKAGVGSATTQIAFGELNVTVPREDIAKVLWYLRDDPECEFKILIDICGVDHPSRPKRFDVVYHLLSVSKNQRVRVKVEAEENVPIPSVV